MTKGDFGYKNQERNICSMLKNSMNYILVLASLLFVPLLAPAWVQAAPIFISPNTGSEDVQLYFFWDLRGRESFFQLINLGSAATIHIQVFNVAANCAEFDFADEYTTNDTHVYNVRDLSIINSGKQSPPILTDGYGFIVATISGVDARNFPAISTPTGLVGNFRVVDASGYEYRSNAAGLLGAIFGSVIPNTGLGYTMNFNDLNGINSADVVAIPVRLGLNPLQVVSTFFADLTPHIYDTAENAISCPEVEFGCADGLFDYGINQAIKNSKGGDSICLGTNTNGFLRLDLNIGPPTSDQIEESIFVFVGGFIGLNNGDGTGSMDTWWAKPSSPG